MLSCQSVTAQHCPWQALTSLQLGKQPPCNLEAPVPPIYSALACLLHPPYPHNLYAPATM